MIVEHFLRYIAAACRSTGVSKKRQGRFVEDELNEPVQKSGSVFRLVLST